ncbi:MAG: hypothetical protein ACRD9L_24910, partial [Bryobacteraceae bacterium]
INGTFAFCSSLGLKQKRVMKSIADGCFQTLRSLQAAETAPAESPLRKSSDHLRATGRLGHVTPNPNGKRAGNACPFYLMEGKPFVCPFVQAAEALPLAQKSARRELLGIHKTCATDKDHSATPRRETRGHASKGSRHAHGGQAGDNGTVHKAMTSVPRASAP